MTPAQQIALWADRLRDISAMGLIFCTNIHDRIAFEGVQAVAMEMQSVATGEPWEQIEPLRAPIFSRPTPMSVGDAAVIDDKGQILLVKRADNGQWAMPGGALEVGETPAEGVAREALEETGVRCRAVALVGVFDSRLCGTVSRYHLYQFVFLCDPITPGETVEPSTADEVLEVAWFPENALPEGIDPGHISRIPEAFRVWRGDNRPFFDDVSRRE